MEIRKLNSTNYPVPFLLVLSTDHTTGAVGATPTVTIRKPGGSFSTPSGAITEVANGWYELAGNATDRNTLGSTILHATASLCDVYDTKVLITAIDLFDVVAMGMTSLNSIFSSGVTVTPSGANQIADATLTRDWTAVSGEAPFSLLNAQRAVRNKFSISGSGLTVYKENGLTTAWTSTLGTTAGANPITGSTPS